jgi:putative peptidoglycan lipid II flippase
MATGGARLVAAGILLSRVFGLVRQRVTAHFLGSGEAADALAAAFRIPNLLQNLFGEGSLSASLIPVYARLLAEGRREDAGRVAGAVLSLLAMLIAGLVLLGLAAAPWLVDLIAPGFDGDTRELTIVLVRVILPGLGLLVLSAWCLGILNAHRRFFLSYASPVLWNVAIMAAVLWSAWRGDATMADVAMMVAWGSVVGSFLQLVIQLPTVFRLERGLSLTAGSAAADVRTVVRNFGPAVATRGVVQVSAYVDTILVSLLGAGAMATLGYAQAIAMLPVSLFGMSIAASELPTMSGATGEGEALHAALRARLASGLRRIAYFVIPSAVAFVGIGGALAGALYVGGAFGAEDARWVWVALAGAGVGLLAGTMGRLYASASFALRDTRTPFRYAAARVAVGGALGATLALTLPGALGVDPRWGIGIVTAASGVAAWLECALLRRHIHRRIGPVELPITLQLRLWVGAVAALGAALIAQQAADGQHPVLVGVVVGGAYGATYLVATRLLGADSARRA